MNISHIPAKYRECLVKYPLSTKAVTAGIVGCLGELIGLYIRRKNSLGNGKVPFDWKRFVVFGFYGLAVSGPVFHIWYSQLEILTNNIPRRFRVFAKILIDRLLFTPPFLLLTLTFIQILQTFSVIQSINAVKKTYSSALLTNWKVYKISLFNKNLFKYFYVRYGLLLKLSILILYLWNIVSYLEM